MVCWQLNLRTDLFCTHTKHCYAIIRKTGSKSNGGKKESAAERGFWLVLFSPSWKVQFTHRLVYF